MEKKKLCHTDTEDTETRFVISNYGLDRPLPKEKKVIGLMKDQLGGKSR